MYSKLCLATALVAGSLALPAQGAVIGFTGPYAPGNWSASFTGNLGGAGGSVFNSTSMVVITGGNDLSPNPPQFTPACTGATAGVLGNCEVRYVTTNIQSPFSFDWSYVSSDTAGAGDDLFGVLLDGARTQLSDPGGALTQTGHSSFAANTSFGWFVNCTDCIEGAAVVTITNFRAGAVPEPEVLALFGLGLFAGVASRRRRSTPAVRV